jgi:hypothetical protein
MEDNELLINKITKLKKQIVKIEDENVELRDVILNNNNDIFDNIFVKNIKLKEENYNLMIENNDLKKYNNKLIIENKKLIETNKNNNLVKEYLFLKGELYNIKRHYYSLQDSILKKK